MSYLIKKNELKANRFYRKKKLDINELVDEFEAQQDLGLDKSIYGDDEGYILVARKAENHYIVRFITLENLLINNVLKVEFSSIPSGSGIINVKVDIDIDNLDNIKKINKEKLDLDEMDDTYVKLDITNIINELIEQYKTGGKKGIRLDKIYTEGKVKTTKFKKEPKKEPKKEDLFEIFTKSANIDERMEELWYLIEGDSFDGPDPAQGKKLIEYQDELLTLKIRKLKQNDDYNKEDIFEELNIYPVGKPYSSFINFEKILRQENLLKKNEEFEKLDRDFIQKLESIRGSLGGSISGQTANPNLFKSPLTIVSKELGIKLDEDFDFGNINPEMIKTMENVLK